MGSFRGTFRETPTIAVFTRLFSKAKFNIPSLISGANSKKYEVDTVEPCYYGRWWRGGGGGGGGGTTSVLVKKL